MAAEYQVITNPVVNVTITSTISSFGSERRFQKDLTICNLKGKLELLTGAQSGSMQLEVYDKDDKVVCQLDNDEALLGSYPIDDGMRIHVIDKSGKVGEFEDLSKVEKYEMADDAYENRADSVRAFKQRMKLGRFNPEEQEKKDEEKKKKEEEEAAAIAAMKVGDRCMLQDPIDDKSTLTLKPRETHGCVVSTVATDALVLKHQAISIHNAECQVRTPGQPTKLGTVMYLGDAEFKPGKWVGVKYDEPLGKNDGSVQGKRYFECPAKYGGFVKPANVEVGDFPEENFDDDLEM